MSKQVRLFPMPCCQLWKKFVYDDFNYEGRMTLICHKHPELISYFLTWKGGKDLEVFEREVEEYRQEKIKKNSR